MNHSLNLTHDGTLIVRVPKGYKVEKVKVETFEGEEIPTHTTPSNTLDCISRQAAIEVASRECHEFRGIFADIEKGLNHLPSVQPRTGKWEDETFKPWGPVFHPYKCDQCGEHSEAPSNFCPNCGAEMR